MDVLFNTVGVLLVLSCLAAFWIKNRERLVTLSLLQALVALPLLAGVYLVFSGQKSEPQMVQALLFWEGLFGVVWVGLAFRLGRVSGPDSAPRGFAIVQCMVGAFFITMLAYSQALVPAVEWTEMGLAVTHYGQAYFYALFMLLAVLFSAWQMESFWRTLEPARRWAYKFLVIGGFMVCAALGWASSYRLTYGLLVADHFHLLAVLLVVAWAFMGYAVARHKLLNRKIFISRKVVYSFVAPTVFAVYLIALGFVGMLMQVYGLSMPFVLHWMAVAFGVIAIGLFAVSGKLRRRVKFFISTHFYVNKYEYRDEWLALSARLKGAVSEADVVEALRDVLTGSLYADRIVIWTGDGQGGYFVMAANPPLEGVAGRDSNHLGIAADDPVMAFLAGGECLDLQNPGEGRSKVRKNASAGDEKGGLFRELGIVLVAPLLTGDQVVGLIGLGPEFTGGEYGHDDYDLLIALGSQAAAALVAVRMAEKLAEEREQRAWASLSAFVLHDVKNASAMLSLLRANAAEHIHKPAFQADMLEVVDDALMRMGKVQQRLGMLKAGVEPAWTDVDLKEFLEETCARIGRKLPGMAIEVSCPDEVRVQSDPDMLLSIIENLLLNAFEACETAEIENPAVRVEATVDNDRRYVSLSISDNGPGIDESLLPEALFEPMKSTREKGSGIGLWQARQVATRLRGSLKVVGAEGVGARFSIILPL